MDREVWSAALLLLIGNVVIYVPGLAWLQVWLTGHGLSVSVWGRRTRALRLGRSHQASSSRQRSFPLLGGSSAEPACGRPKWLHR
jgi:hypothetical protein